MNRIRRIVLLALIIPACFLPDAMAQVPAHPAGTICFTPKFWCWANPPGPPGARCSCPTPFGPVPGVLG